MATLLGRKTSYGFSAIKVEEILSSNIQIERTDEIKERKALKYFEKYADKEISFTDCLSFVVMQRLKINQVFTFDRHFSDAGFEIIPNSFK